MFGVATLNPNHTLQLPVEIARQFQPSDRFIVWTEGETLHLKRLMPSPLKAVEQAPADEPLSLDEINDIVHEVRRHRKVE
jgi:hypothetical protein